jgi:chitodextrinase
MVLGAKARSVACLYFSLVLAACTESDSEQGPVDTNAPVPGAAISFSDVAATSVTVSWGAAEDDWTGANGLKYKLVRAAEAAEIDTLEEVEAITGPGLIQDYVKETTSKAVSGLSAGAEYAFAVAVRDQTGNRALYAPASVATLDKSAPVPGTDIGFVDIAATGMTVSWGEASDDATPAEQLEYKLVRALTAAAIDTLAEIRAITSAPGLVRDFTTALTSTDVTGLSSATRYAFAVVVRDSVGNEALYSPATVSTPDVAPPAIGTPITFGSISPDGVTVHWGPASDAVTGPAGLRYKVVKASDASAIDTLDEVDAIFSGDGLVKDFEAGIVSVAVTGLPSSTSYAFAVVVRDGAGNRALYAPATVTTLDVSAPTAGTPISVSSVSATGLSLSWGAATDDVSAAGALQYKVVKAANAAAIDTLAEVALISAGSDLVQDFSSALLSQAVTGLTSSTTYAFAVVVRDQQGNQAIYTPVTQRTLDDTPPVPGAALSFANVATSGLTVNWGEATDNVTSQSDLQYKLVMAASAGSIDTIAEVDAITSAPGLVMDFSADLASRNVSGLAASTSYAFALLVRDAAGNKALYAPATASTLDVSAPVVGAAISFGTVTTTQITAVWGAASDDVTPAASLTYKVVMGADAAAVDTLTEIDMITSAPGLIADYTANLTTATVTGLTSSTSYAFAVVVRDAAGNRALYSPALRATLDVTAPTRGAAIGFSNVSSAGLSVDWGAASDDTTLVADLQYKVVRADLISDIDDLSEVAAITSGPNLLQDFMANTTTLAVTGLTSSTEYAFAVVVRDAAGNEALYAPDNVSTLDVTAPTLGSALIFSSVADTSLTVSWGAADDDVTDGASLEYKLVRAASSSDIDTLDEVEAITAAPGLIADFAPGLISAPVTGLSASTSYAFAVVVRDAAGNERLYTPDSVTTTP